MLELFLTVSNKVKNGLWFRFEYKSVFWAAECACWKFIFAWKISFRISFMFQNYWKSVIHTGVFSNSLKAIKDFKNCTSIIPRAAKGIEKMHLCRILHSDIEIFILRHSPVHVGKWFIMYAWCIKGKNTGKITINRLWNTFLKLQDVLKMRVCQKRLHECYLTKKLLLS